MFIFSLYFLLPLNEHTGKQRLIIATKVVCPMAANDDVLTFQECSIMNSTLLRCILPDVRDRITEIPEDVGLGLPYDVQLDRLILTPRQLQETMEYRRIKLYGDPIVLPLGNLPDHVIAYEPDVMIKIKVCV